MSTNSLTNTPAPASCPSGVQFQPSTKRPRAKWVRLVAVALAAGFLGTGCAVYPTGYGQAYYEPDYSPYYSDYGYGGAPFAGFFGGDIIVGGGHHHGYYGGHHFGHDFHGGGHHGGGHGHH